MDDYESIRIAVQDAGADTPSDRAAVYLQLQEALRQQIDNIPFKLRRGLTHRIRELREATQQYEKDALKGALRPALAPAVKEAADPTIPTVLTAAPLARPLGRIRSSVTLTFRYLVLLSRAGPAAAFWIVVEPLLQILLIVGLYALTGRSQILDMEAVPFALLGISAIIMFRMIMMRVAMPLPEPALLLIPRIRAVDMMLGRTFGTLIIYSTALAVALLILALFGVQEDFDDALHFVEAWGCIALLGFGLGVTLRGLVAYAPFLQRAVPWLARLLFWISGVMFVSEQLPDFVARYLLLNPLLNAIQGLRSAFFVSYESVEISLLYAFVWGIGLTTLGLSILATRVSDWK